MVEPLKPLIAIAVERALTGEEARLAFDTIMSGDATPAQTAGFLTALRMRGETVDEIAAAATVMREKALAVRAPAGAIDIVGTGGDGKHTLNISTAAALIVAGAGVPVAKHGNRGLSSRSGASDALASLGVNLDAGVPAIEQCLGEASFGYMAAPNHHSAMKYVGPVRRELGIRTLFNILGPMTNPAGVRRQLTGVFAPDFQRPMAETLRVLGCERCWIVHGGDGSDELSISAPSVVVALENGELSEFPVTPEDAGLPEHPFEDIVGGEPEENAARLRALLAGAKDAYRDAACLNAGAALVIAGKAADLREGAALAAESIDSGAARRTVETVARITSAT